MDNNTFSFDLIDSELPKIVIEHSLEQIEQATKGYVLGKIKKYEGEIYPYTKKNPLLSVMRPFEPEEVCIQSIMGEYNTQKYKYEVFLTAKNLLHYKFRMMFLEYSEISYPVTVVLNENIVSEDDLEKYVPTNYYMTYEIDSMKDLIELMEIVLNSDIVIRRIQSLIDESMRQEINVDQVEELICTEHIDRR